MKNIDCNYELCYPITCSSMLETMRQLSLHKREKNVIYEIRVDYLLNAGKSVFSTIDVLRTIRIFHKNQKFIATVRTDKEGGVVSMDKNAYYDVIKLLIEHTPMDYYDIEYKFYKAKKQQFDQLISKNNKKIILSTHIFDKVYNDKKYNNLFKEVVNENADIIKFAIMTRTKKDVMQFMESSRLNSKILKEKGKKGIFIAMGKIGKISRVFPEYTNSAVVFIKNADKKPNLLGQTDKNEFLKCRKLLAKYIKN